MTGTKHPRRRGQSIVELAFATPVLLLLLLGTIDLGRVFFEYVQIRNAAREGAGYGAHFPADTAGIQLRVERHGVPEGATTTVDCTDCTLSGGVVTGTELITVTVRSTFVPFTLGFLGGWFGLGPLELEASASMRVLQ